MSLIEEALRKQREETERAQGTGTADKGGPASVAPPPPPLPRGAEPGGEPVKRSWPMLLGIVAGLILAVLFLAWMLVFGFKLFRKPPALEVAEQPPVHAAPAAAASPAATTGTVAAAAVTPPATTPAVPTTPTPAPEPATATATATATVQVASALPSPRVVEPQPDKPAAEEPASPVAQAQAPAPAAPAAVQAPAVPNVTATPQVAAPAPAAPVAPAAPAPAPKLVVWPRLAVTGVMGGRAGHGAVIINGQMLNVGETVEGARIVSADRRGVTLTFSGETRTVAVGTATE